jgi:hypothetical protein
MSTDFRALCEELLDELQALRLAVAYEVGCPSPEHPVVLRARAALAQPEPVAPTDDELWSVGNDDFRANCYPTDAIYYARAVLARWGTPANNTRGTHFDD